MSLCTRTAGTSWGANAKVLRNSFIALCYSVAEYCALSGHDLLMRVWSIPSWTQQCDSSLELSNSAPPPLRRKEATDKLISKIHDYSHWPVYNDIYEHPDQLLTSRSPLWNDLEPCDLASQWGVLRGGLGDQLVPCGWSHYPSSRIRSIQAWMVPIKRFRTAQSHCRACRKTWRPTDGDNCQCWEIQTMLHMAETCSFTKLEGGLMHLHSADESAVRWLTSFEVWSYTITTTTHSRNITST